MHGIVFNSLNGKKHVLGLITLAIFIQFICPELSLCLNDLKTGAVDITSISPGVYAEMLNQGNNALKYIITVKGPFGDHYFGHIFVRKDSNLKSITDLKGKSMGFVDVGSSSGYKYPISIFLKANILPDNYFSDLFFLGSHDKVVDGVAGGQVTIGATGDQNYLRGIKKYGDIFYTITKTPPIPADAWVAANSVKVLLASGFRKDERVESLINLGVNDFIQKPYTLNKLSQIVHKVINT